MSHNPEVELARQLIFNTSANVFLTGKAGTGKTTFLRRLVKECPKRCVVLAPTGIAAINAGGQTIHSFLQIPFAPFVPGANYNQEQMRVSGRKIKRSRSLDLLIIDEISMVRADLLDNIDAVLRRYRNRFRPFGGVQLLMIGDLQQLAPVVKPEDWAMLSPHYETAFFFSSQALQQTHWLTVELHKVYRQEDARFVDLLNAVRTNRADAGVLAALNERYVPDFVPPKGEGYVRLVTHNNQADGINREEMEAIEAPEEKYKAVVNGQFPEYSYPTAEVLHLKVGAQVMFVKNDSSIEKRFFNGMLGEVVELRSSEVTVRPHDGGPDIEVAPEEWLNARYALNEKTGEIEEIVDGTFKQIPLRLAWAITIHKSQGLTFEHAIINAAGSFAHGQAYVALSRCKSLEGMVLAAPLTARAIIQDRTVSAFSDGIADQVPSASAVEQLERDYFRQLAFEVFDLQPIHDEMKRYTRFLEAFAHKQQPFLVLDFREGLEQLGGELLPVMHRFFGQLDGLIGEYSDYRTLPLLQERMQKGAAYFLETLLPMVGRLAKTPLALNNKEHMKRGRRMVDELNELFRVKGRVLKYVIDKGFSPTDYLKVRALAVVDSDADESKTKSADKEKPAAPKKPKRLSKEESMAVTVKLFGEGKSPDEVAIERGLSPATIWSHLSEAAIEGRVPLLDLVSAEKIRRITAFYEQQSEPVTLSEAREAIGTDVEFHEIRLVASLMPPAE